MLESFCRVFFFSRFSVANASFKCSSIVLSKLRLFTEHQSDEIFSNDAIFVTGSEQLKLQSDWSLTIQSTRNVFHFWNTFWKVCSSNFITSWTVLVKYQTSSTYLTELLSNSKTIHSGFDCTHRIVFNRMNCHRKVGSPAHAK